MNSVRTAVVGVGHFGSLHTAKHAAEPASQLVAVVDIDPERASSVAAEFGVEAGNDYRELIGRVDAVSIAVPTSAHHEVAKFFLDHGIHVLVEKPITSSVAEADDLIARAHARKLVLQVGHLERFSIGETVLQDAVTTPVFIEAVRISPFGSRGTDVSVVLDLMIHDIDLIASLVGSPAERVDAVGARVLSDHEDIVNTRLLFANGCVANVTASRISFKSERRLRVFQPDSMLSIDFLTKRLFMIRKKADLPPERAATPSADQFDIQEHAFSEQDPLAAEIRSFVTAVASHGSPIVSGEDGREALAIGNRIIDSLQAHFAEFGERLLSGHEAIRRALDADAGDSARQMGWPPRV